MTTELGGKTGVDIRAKLDHPVVDSDGHMMETSFAVLDFGGEFLSPGPSYKLVRSRIRIFQTSQCCRIWSNQRTDRW